MNQIRWSLSHSMLSSADCHFKCCLDVYMKNEHPCFTLHKNGSTYKVILEKFHHNILSCVYLEISILSRYYQHIFTFTVSISCLSKKLYIILTLLFKYRNVSRQSKQFGLSRNVLQVTKYEVT